MVPVRVQRSKSEEQQDCWHKRQPREHKKPYQRCRSQQGW
jgi:hypothetical protein